MPKRKIPEIRYRASRICRSLGNPTAYEILHILRQGEKTPEELVRLLGVSFPSVSQALRKLRDLDLIRYEVLWRKRVYWIKVEELSAVMLNLEQLVRVIRSQE